MFVYGTLRRGRAHHGRLRGAVFLGGCRTPPRYTLVDLGPCPALLPGGRMAVPGEVYDVGRRLLARLDRFEGPEYCRRRIPTPYGEAWVYVYRRRPGLVPRRRPGPWRPRGL